LKRSAWENHVTQQVPAIVKNVPKLRTCMVKQTTVILVSEWRFFSGRWYLVSIGLGRLSFISHSRAGRLFPKDWNFFPQSTIQHRLITETSAITKAATEDTTPCKRRTPLCLASNGLVEVLVDSCLGKYCQIYWSAYSDFHDFFCQGLLMLYKLYPIFSKIVPRLLFRVVSSLCTQNLNFFIRENSAIYPSKNLKFVDQWSLGRGER
jgi:hypothetical protein